MGSGYGVDRNGIREIGHTVPATCDHPGCEEKIDRGLAYACGGQPFEGEYYCDGYFCMKHLSTPSLHDRDYESMEALYKRVIAVCAACAKEIESEWAGKGTPQTVATADDERPVVPIASLAPAAPDETMAAPSSLPNGLGRPVVPVLSLAPDGDENAAYDVVLVGGEMYTQTLAELYASQGATANAIEVYRKLIATDPDDEALNSQLAELESLRPDSHGVPDERQAVPIESLAPDGNTGDGTPDDPFPWMNRL